jgi:adenylate cyclase
MYSEDVEGDLIEASLLASQAVEHVEDDAPALVAISAAYSLIATDLTPAFAFVRRALDLDPNNAWGHMRLGWTFVYDGQSAKALNAFGHAQRLSPLDPFLHHMQVGIATAYAELGETNLAIRTLHETLTHAPRLTWSYRLLATLYSRVGDSENAKAAASRLLEAYPGLTADALYSSLSPAMAARDRQHLEELHELVLFSGAEG